jgi:cyanophycin synthetase
MISGRYPNVIEEDLYDNILQNTFNIFKQKTSNLKYNSLKISQDALLYFDRSFCLARHLLQESGMPAFSTEVIHHFDLTDEGTNGFRLICNVPVMQYVYRKHIAAAYEHGLKLMWLAAAEDYAALKQKADELLETFIGPMRRSLGRGLSTRPLLQEAHRRGLPIDHLGYGVYQLGTGARSRIISKSATDRDSSIGAMIAQQKDWAEIWFKSVGVPVAQTIAVLDADAAVAAARKIGFPAVVKPANLERSEGVSLDLATDEDVRAAFERARTQSTRILVQSRIAGHCHRLVAFRGKFVFGYSRLPAAIKGDGKNTTRELIESANFLNSQRARHMQSKPLPLDDETLSCLRTQGLTADDILDEGRLAFLRVNNVPGYPGHNEVITDTVHPENIALVERLARVFRLESVGVDFVSTDPARPFHENGAAITEVNFQPQIGENTARHNLNAMFPDGELGAIPVECFVGGDRAMKLARHRLAELASSKLNVALTSHALSLDTQAMPYRLAGVQGLRERCIAFLRDPAIEALIVVVQTDEFLRTGPPFMHNVRVIHVDTDVRGQYDAKERIGSSAVADLLQALAGH